jgi:hypothetical protein
MAKRKRSAALFEVFHDSKSASAGRLSTGHSARGWFKARAEAPATNIATAIDPDDPTTGAIRSGLIAPRIAAVEAMAAPTTATSTGMSERIEPVRPRSAAQSTTNVGSRIQLDAESKHVKLMLPARTIIAASFAIVVVVGLSYILGHHAGASPSNAGTNDQATDDSTTVQPIQPKALEVPRRAVAGQGQQPIKAPVSRRGDDVRRRDADSEPRSNDVSQLHDNQSRESDGTDGPRIIGLNYLLVQVYPSQAGAAEARDFLLKNGIGCTIEKVPEGYYGSDKTWLAVITTRGFDRDQLHSAEYDSFKQKIENLSGTFSAKSKSKQFSLQTYKLMK